MCAGGRDVGGGGGGEGRGAEGAGRAGGGGRGGERGKEVKVPPSLEEGSFECKDITKYRLNRARTRAKSPGPTIPLFTPTLSSATPGKIPNVVNHALS